MRRDLVEKSAVHSPAPVSAQRAEVRGAVSGEGLDVNVGESVRLGAAHDVLDSVMETWRCGDAMQLREPRNVILRSRSRQLGIERDQNFATEQRLGRSLVRVLSRGRDRGNGD